MARIEFEELITEVKANMPFTWKPKQDKDITLVNLDMFDLGIGTGNQVGIMIRNSQLNETVIYRGNENFPPEPGHLDYESIVLGKHDELIINSTLANVNVYLSASGEKGDFIRSGGMIGFGDFNFKGLKKNLYKAVYKSNFKMPAYTSCEAVISISPEAMELKREIRVQLHVINDIGLSDSTAIVDVILNSNYPHHYQNNITLRPGEILIAKYLGVVDGLELVDVTDESPAFTVGVFGTEITSHSKDNPFNKE